MPDPLDREGIGFIGLGKMGLPMAGRLAAAGADVIGHDVDPSSRDRAAAAGLTVVDAVQDVARRARLVVLMLPTSAIVESVVASLLEVPDAERACRTILDMSSSEPSRTVALAAHLESRGIALLDAPVSGGVIGAEAGSLTIMVGGDDAHLAQVSPVLDHLGASVVHTGPAGSGHAVKALNNLMSAAHLLVTDEALVVAARFGVDPETVLSVVNTSSGRSGSSQLKLPRYVLPRTFDSGFTAALLAKDVRIATGLADELGVDASLSHAVLERWQQLSALLPEDADHTEIVRPMEDREQVTLTLGPLDPSA